MLGSCMTPVLRFTISPSDPPEAEQDPRRTSIYMSVCAKIHYSVFVFRCCTHVMSKPTRPFYRSAGRLRVVSRFCKHSQPIADEERGFLVSGGDLAAISREERTEPCPLRILDTASISQTFLEKVLVYLPSAFCDPLRHSATRPPKYPTIYATRAPAPFVLPRHCPSMRYHRADASKTPSPGSLELSPA